MNSTIPLLSLAATLAATWLTAADLPRPDLAVSELAPGALCVGSSNEVVVTVVNRAAGPAKSEFDVLLTVQLPGRPPTTLRSTVGSLGPGSRADVRFVRIEVPVPAEVLLRAEADPDRVVDDDHRANNTAAALVSAAEECGARSSRRGDSGPATLGGLARALFI